jgi:predicted Zn-dependent protease
MAQQHGSLYPNNQYQAFVDEVGNKLVNNSIAQETPYQ